MKYREEDTKLYIELPVRISSDNADEFERELFDIHITDNISEIVLDASELMYISSVGLRTLLKYRKKIRPDMDMCIIEVGLLINEIFENTGFEQIFRVEKALRTIEVNDLTELGRGMYGSVYRIDDEKVLKVFHGANTRNELEKILGNMRTAFVKGIPAIIPFEMVKTEKGNGMVFELLDSKCLADIIHEDGSRLDECAKKMAHLSKLMANTHFEEGTIGSRNRKLMEELESASFVLTGEQLDELKGYIENVPERDTAVHGDFHARNVFLSDGEPMLIDMDDFCLGHPIWDIACLYRVYPYLYSLDPGEAEELFDLGGEMPYEEFYYHVMHLDFREAEGLWKLFVKYYFEGVSRESLDRMMEAAGCYSDFMVIRFIIDQCRSLNDNKDALDRKRGLITRILSRMREYDMKTVKETMDRWE